MCPLVVADLNDRDAISAALNDFKIDSVIHLAALKSPEESTLNADLYKYNNDRGTKTLLEESRKQGVEIFIQSSSSSVYGNQNRTPIAEVANLAPVSPYGFTKLANELLLNKYVSEGSLKGTSLRFFNVVGTKNRALKDDSSFNLFPIIERALSSSQVISIYGDDYETKDGTCIRDYVHVEDVALAHIVAAEKLLISELPQAMNIGTGEGYSVLEVIHEFEKLTQKSVRYRIVKRRKGDPSTVIADVNLARSSMKFSAEKNLSQMISSIF
jgi:UDP-glucose 4-epimerase